MQLAGNSRHRCTTINKGKLPADGIVFIAAIRHQTVQISAKNAETGYFPTNVSFAIRPLNPVKNFAAAAGIRLPAFFVPTVTQFPSSIYVPVAKSPSQEELRLRCKR
jgi:hypothetical protein